MGLGPQQLAPSQGLLSMVQGCKSKSSKTRNRTGQVVLGKASQTHLSLHARFPGQALTCTLLPSSA